MAKPQQPPKPPMGQTIQTAKATLSAKQFDTLMTKGSVTITETRARAKRPPLSPAQQKVKAQALKSINEGFAQGVIRTDSLGRSIG